MNTTFWRNTIMDDIYGDANREYYIGLSSTEPTVAGGNVTEPISNGYARVRITQFTQSQDGTVRNAQDIVFPLSTGTWFDENHLATHWVMFDGAGANAHLISAGTLEVPIGIWKNTIVTIAANKVVITLLDGANED